MAKTKKSPKGKRGPKEERLVIADPQAAIDALLKKKPATK
ncbi:hypothetical protein GCM10011507_02450 [Edaphobacter acidisoli]|uniref:Uncharacterized protein n=1 Tax=Edaphobacter acidisoli TaxID=2040573 RepID=A0A916VZS1_9BACT|nr:hypothetical protein GCM10011507_02450 [Edaphobacter acidisoli]